MRLLACFIKPHYALCSNYAVTPGKALQLFQQLRQASLPAHRAIEQQPWLHALLQPTLDKATYARVLHCFRLFYTEADAHFAAQGGPPSAAYRYEPRLPHLTADCDALADSFWPPTEPSPDLTPVTDIETLIGRLYVVEGSSQGGMIIGPRVARVLTLTSSTGLGFFTHFSEEGNRWPCFQTFIRTLHDEGDHRLCTTRILQASNRFFADLDSFFTICSEAWGDGSQHGRQ
jgi:heme oxygenase